jgi:hypothetical protein
VLNELKTGNSLLLPSDVDFEAASKDLGSIRQFQLRHQLHQLRNKSKDQQIKVLASMLLDLQRLDQNDPNNALDFFRVGLALFKLQPEHPALLELKNQPFIKKGEWKETKHPKRQKILN